MLAGRVDGAVGGAGAVRGGGVGGAARVPTGSRYTRTARLVEGVLSMGSVRVRSESSTGMFGRVPANHGAALG